MSPETLTMILRRQGDNATKHVEYLGDTNRLMTIQELKEDYKDFLLIDSKSGESIDIEKLENLDIEEVVVKKRDEECC